MRYMSLVDWKDFLPAVEVKYLAGWKEALPASGILWDTRQCFAEKVPSAPAGGYPQRIPGDHL
jgi:hypothetical protein